MHVLKLTLTSLAALGVAAVAGLYVALHEFGGASASAPPSAMMAMPVPVAPVVRKTLSIYLDYPGRIELIRSIALQARVSGYIDAQPAADGADVKSGELLYKIDPRDLQAALDQANAQAQRDTALLEYARANFSRGEELVKSGFVTKDAYDQRESTMRQTEAALVLDRAAIEAARLNLSYTEIRRRSPAGLGVTRRRKAPWSVRRAGRSTRWLSSIRSTFPSTRANPTLPKLPGRAQAARWWPKFR